MRIPLDALDTVAFIGVEGDSGVFTPVGTAFFIVRREAETDFAFAMTAAHVVDDLTEAAKARLVIRVNRQDGSSRCVSLNGLLRIDHPDRANDIALFSIRLDKGFRYFAVSVSRQELEAERDKIQGTRAGDPVCAIGLYTSHYGSVSNSPVVRTGNMAAVANEPIWTPRGHLRAHLIELRTIAGLSGSPVFQTTLPVMIRDGRPMFRENEDTGTILMGMLLGYHAVEYKDDQIPTPQLGHQQAGGIVEPSSTDERNTGFGIVVPIERVIEYFESDAFRARVLVSLMATRGPIAAAVAMSEPSE